MNKSKKKKKWKKSEWKLFFIVLPFIIVLFLLTYVPIGGWIISLFDYRPGKALADCTYIGFKYFKGFFKDAGVIQSMKNTLIFSGVSLLLSPLPMLFAICLNEISSTKYRKTVQVVTTLPHFISWIIVYSLAFAIFASDGILNSVLLKLGVINEPLLPLQNESIVYPFQIAMERWKELGWAAIIYIAAIAGIDQNQYEAAYMDGAGHLASAWYITVPSLMETFFVQLLLMISNIVNTGYEQYFVFKNSLVYDKIEVLDLYIYRMGLQLGDYSYSTAVGILQSFISIGMLFLANSLAKKIRGQAII